MGGAVVSARPIGELIAGIVANAIELSRRNGMLSHIDDPSTRKILIMRWWERGEITPDQVELLIEHNELVAA